MSKIPTSLVGIAHSYTRAKVPWRLDAYREAYGETSKGTRFGWKLFHYISGGGIHRIQKSEA